MSCVFVLISALKLSKPHDTIPAPSLAAGRHVFAEVHSFALILEN